MSSWMKTLQSGANKVGNEAAKLKLYAEISLLKGDIKSLKEAWGVTCFDLYSQGDANGVNASHAKQLVKIREKEAKVQAKIVELNKLKAPKEPVVVDSTPDRRPDRRGAAADADHGRAGAARRVPGPADRRRLAGRQNRRRPSCRRTLFQEPCSTSKYAGKSCCGNAPLCEQRPSLASCKTLASCQKEGTRRRARADGKHTIASLPYTHLSYHLTRIREQQMRQTSLA